MNVLIAGILVFMVIHLVPSFPNYRARLIELVGAGPYKGLFSVVSVLGLVLIVYGLKISAFELLYTPPGWGRGANMILMLLAVYLFFSNSLGPAPSSIKTVTAHPLNWSIVVWSTGHLLANGDKAHVLLFGSFLIFAVVSIITGNARGMKPALEQRPPLLSELVFVAVTVAIYLGLFLGHRYFTGVPLA